MSWRRMAARSLRRAPRGAERRSRCGSHRCLDGDLIQVRVEMNTESVTTDYANWLERWDAQQQRHIPDREERFAAMVDAVAAFAGPEPRVLDLGCGPGSLSARVLDRVPGATVVAIDADPVLLAIGRGALATGKQLQFVDADLRADWVSALPSPGPYDAAV